MSTVDYSFKYPKHEIVPLKRDDISEYLELLELCFIHCIESQNFDFTQEKNNLRKINCFGYKILLKIRGKELLTYLFKSEQKIVSAISLKINNKQGIICNVMTHPDFRRRGFAKKMLTFVIDVARKRKLKEISLEVHPLNESAIKLYKLEDFEIIHNKSKKSICTTIKQRTSRGKSISFNTTKNKIYMQRKMT